MRTCPDCKTQLEEAIRPGFFVRRIDLVCPSCGYQEFQGGGLATGQGMLDAVAAGDRPLMESHVARNLALDSVCKERDAQLTQWGDQSGLHDSVWLAILTEEVGELAQEVLRNLGGGPGVEALRAELVQVVAVGVAWLEAMDARGASVGPAPTHDGVQP